MIILLLDSMTFISTIIFAAIIIAVFFVKSSSYEDED
jgi:hypothetical protein